MPPELNAVSCSGRPEVMGRASVNMFRAGNELANILQAPLRHNDSMSAQAPMSPPVLSFLSSFVKWSCGPSQTSRTLPSASFFHLTILLLPLSWRRKPVLLSLFS